jgi:hypothetical protein
MTNFTKTAASFADKASEVGERAQDLAYAAGRSLDDARDDTGGALHAAATHIRETGRKGSEAIHGIATGTAARLDATGSYVENHDLRGMLQGFGRRHLTGSLLAAAAVGFFAGSALFRRRPLSDLPTPAR